MKTIGPNVWGPHGWKFMHYVSLGYPQQPTENDKRNYKEFYSNLKNVLPCKTCAINYERNLTELPIDNALQSRDSLVKWVIDIHNKVNEAIPHYLLQQTLHQKFLHQCFSKNRRVMVVFKNRLVRWKTIWM